MAATYVKYGSYQFPAGLVDVSLTKTARRSPRGLPQKELWRMSLSGTLIADGQSAINTAIRNLEEAFAVPNQTLAVHLGSGAQSVHKLDAGTSLSGVQIVQPPSFPTGRDAEFATGRTFTIVAESEYAVDGADAYLEWNESISVTGDGGPDYAVRNVMNGEPQLHVIHSRTPVYVTQQGNAVGFLARPLPPAPINWGVFLGARKFNSNQAPKVMGNSLQGFPVRWAYQFVNTTPAGVPNPSVR